MEEISDHAKNLTLSEDLEKPLEERVDLFYNFVKVSSVRLNTLSSICGYLSRPGATWTRSRCRQRRLVYRAEPKCELLV